MAYEPVDPLSRFAQRPNEHQATLDRRNKVGEDDTIGNWSKAQLAKFIENQLANSPPSLPQSLIGQTITASKRLVVTDRIQLSAQALKYIKDNLPL